MRIQLNCGKGPFNAARNMPGTDEASVAQALHLAAKERKIPEPSCPLQLLVDDPDADEGDSADRSVRAPPSRRPAVARPRGSGRK